MPHPSDIPSGSRGPVPLATVAGLLPLLAGRLPQHHLAGLVAHLQVGPLEHVSPLCVIRVWSWGWVGPACCRLPRSGLVARLQVGRRGMRLGATCVLRASALASKYAFLAFRSASSLSMHIQRRALFPAPQDPLSFATPAPIPSVAVTPRPPLDGTTLAARAVAATAAAIAAAAARSNDLRHRQQQHPSSATLADASLFTTATRTPTATATTAATASAAPSPASLDMWRGPSWVNTNYLVAVGLREQRHPACDTLAEWVEDRCGAAWEYVVVLLPLCTERWLGRKE